MSNPNLFFFTLRQHVACCRV